MSRLAAIAMVIASAGCGVSDLSFVQDDRLRIVKPKDRSIVTLPVTIEWEVDGFDITGPTPRAERDAGYFAVFVDRAPPPPGRSVDWLFREDDSCLTSDGCPDAERLRDSHIYITTRTSIEIDRVPRRPSDGRDFHEIVVVLLDGKGDRVGESAFAVELEIRREGT